MFTDSHCHLQMLDLPPAHTADTDALAEAIQHARDAGVQRMMSISVGLDDHLVLAEMATRFDGVGYSVGVHPCESFEMMQRATVEYLVELARAERAWAIGETGLDYYHSMENVTEQKACFARHIIASNLTQKPLVIHTRSSKQDTLDILYAEKAEQGIMHCFTEDWDTAKRALDLGFYISFAGIISFKNANELREVLKKVPLDRLLIETDSPYLAPVPYRGKSNQPKYVPFVAKAIAETLNKPIEEIAKLTSDNFARLMNLPPLAD